MDLQSEGQDGQRAAQRRSRTPFPGCRQAIPQTQIALDPPGKALTPSALEVGKRRRPTPFSLIKTRRYLHIPSFSITRQLPPPLHPAELQKPCRSPIVAPTSIF